MAVDLAKHGECVAEEAYKKYDNLLEDWPDFFEKPYKKMRISQGILGKLFRDIDINQIYEAALRDDYKHSICLDYELDMTILNLCKDKKMMHSYLQKVFKVIVKPYIINLREIMLFFNVSNEASLFAGDLK